MTSRLVVWIALNTYPASDPLSSKTPLPVIQLESQASVLRSTLNGFGRWLTKLADEDTDSVSLS